MNAKQLALVEANSANIIPFSDELWHQLIKKDFPNRPPKPNPKAVTAGSRMATKALYNQYHEEQESFKRHSTERLKSFTKMLERQKSENSVIQVEQILRDPTVQPSHAFRGNKNSILNKARRELQSRMLMFPKKAMRTPVRPPPGPVPALVSPRLRPVVKPQKPLVSPQKPLLLPQKHTPVSSPKKSAPSAPQSKSTLESKISIQRKRRKVESSKSLSPTATKPNDSEAKSDIKSIKSSVFH
ncbi:hypothetical protein PSN45_004700 [Yamadazyma tenuis]|nr:hypothetical protein PSN45_004700 [Yamadazyma tenuis]